MSLYYIEAEEAESDIPTLQRGKTVEKARRSIVKFQMSMKDAINCYQSWVEKQSYVPGDLDITGNKEKISGIWVPVWLFEVSTETSWHGRNYHTEYRTVIKHDSDGNRYTDSEGYKVPDPVSSTHYGNYLLPVSALKWITQEEIETHFLKLKRSELQSYDESYLDGWQVQTEDLDKTKAQEICEKRIRMFEEQACKHEVYEVVGCSTAMTYNASYFALLPEFFLFYKYKDRSYFNLIDGRTGAVQGTIPIDKGKMLVGSIVGGVVYVITVLIMLSIISLAVIYWMVR